MPDGYVSGEVWRLETGATSHVGNVRSQNEDSYLVSTKAGVWAVADGMGGHDAGDLASRTVVEELAGIIAPTSAAQLLADCEARLVSANNRLQSIARQRGGTVIGTTVAALLVFEKFFACVWSGDSRIYRIRGFAIEQISIDHTEAQQLVAEGRLTTAEAQTWPHRNVITRAIGARDRPEIEMISGILEPQDIFIICSDGLTGHVNDLEILALASYNPPQRACDLLVSLTLERGATDNVTVIAVRIGPPSAAQVAMQTGDTWGAASE